MKKVKEQAKIAIICDRLDTWGGAEQHMKAISDIYPDAPIYTSVADPEFIKKYFPNRQIITTFIQKLPFQQILKQEYLLLQPVAFNKFDFTGFDLIISITSGFAKNINIPINAKHVCVCLTPPRFLWLEDARSTSKSKKITYNIIYRLVKKPLHSVLRKIDYQSAQKADYILANSKNIVERVKKFYNRKAEYIYPPVEVQNLITQSKKSQKRRNTTAKYLYLGRVEQYKGIELAIRACISLERKLIVAGIGSDFDRMKQLIIDLNGEKYIKMLGFVSEKTKNNLLSNSKALLYPVLDEDFGIVPLEAQACGCPVIAFRKGGVIETISEKHPQTGLFFNEYNANSLARAIEAFEKIKIDPEDCREHAKLFDTKIFKYKMDEYIKNVLKAKKR